MTNGKRPLSIEAKLLESHIIGVLDSDEPTRVITYQELNEAISGDVQGKDRGALYTALARIQRERSIVFRVERAKGIRKAVGEDHTAFGIEAVDSNRRKAKRALEKLQLINEADYVKMTPEVRIKHDGSGTVLSFMARISQGAVMKQIEAKCAESKRQLPYGEVLEAMGK